MSFGSCTVKMPLNQAIIKKLLIKRLLPLKSPKALVSLILLKNKKFTRNL